MWGGIQVSADHILKKNLYKDFDASHIFSKIIYKYFNRSSWIMGKKINTPFLPNTHQL